MATPKIAVYSLPDLKNTTDDALPNYLTSLKFKQSHFLTDVRLALGYTAVIVSAITFYCDYQLGWDATKAYTLWAVLAYFALNSALTYWIWAVERGTVFVGERQGTQVSISSSVTKHTPIYKLSVRYLDSSTPGNSWQTLDVSAPFTNWFSADGYFVAKPFQEWLAAEIPPVGKADPRALREAKGPTGPSASREGGVKRSADVVKTEATDASSSGSSAPPATRSRKAKK
ncbi:MAG: microsomal signal peptidase subunit [Lasallia pustulata]|uniref:Signal peptidase complex subunit 2 n=1 Tax=Lasallia pustulata TaxID=136370 RepID=A0A5M8PKX0_9LECA|nr:MAG: microsomal signal peptidase subunit [Lasallia pustulata]